MPVERIRTRPGPTMSCAPPSPARSTARRRAAACASRPASAHVGDPADDDQPFLDAVVVVVGNERSPSRARLDTSAPIRSDRLDTRLRREVVQRTAQPGLLALVAGSVDPSTRLYDVRHPLNPARKPVRWQAEHNRRAWHALRHHRRRLHPPAPRPLREPRAAPARRACREDRAARRRSARCLDAGLVSRAERRQGGRSRGTRARSRRRRARRGRRRARGIPPRRPRAARGQLPRVDDPLLDHRLRRVRRAARRMPGTT